MRSRVDAICTAVAVIAFAGLVIRVNRAARLPAVVTVPMDALTNLLPEWTARVRAESLHVEFGRQPDPETRDWLRALRSAGTALAWSGDLPAAAVEAEWEPGPSDVALVRVAAASGTSVSVADALGVLDSAQSADGGVWFRFPGAQPALRATVGEQVLYSRPERSLTRRIVVLAPADWESRFVVSALETRGWQVDARLGLGSGSWVTQGRPLPLDTARHGAAIVFGRLEASVRRGVQAFVRQGGGLVLVGGTWGFEELAPGREGSPVRPLAGLTVPRSREQLEYRPIVRLDRDAAPLRRSPMGPRAAVRRIGAGRVMQVGDRETWRLALGSDAGRSEHGDMWSRAVALVSPRDPARSAGGDVAPRAALVAALGEPRPPAPSLSTSAIPWEALLAAALFSGLIAEWAVRRIRGDA